MFGGLLLVAIVVAAFALMLGRVDLARTIGAATVCVAVLAPLLTNCGAWVSPALPSFFPKAFVAGLLMVSLVGGYKKFVDHRRGLHHWFGEPRSSIKNQVEDDL